METVLLVQTIHQDGVMTLTDAGFNVVQTSNYDEQTVINEITDEVVAIIVRTTPLSGAIIEMAPRLRVISKHGIGLDNIDLDTASRKGVVVCNLPGVNEIAVAEHAIMLMLAVAKKVSLADTRTRTGDFLFRENSGATEVTGKTLGIVGLGKIGRRVAAACTAAFGMDTIAFDPFVESAGVIEMVDLKTLLKRSDVVTVHAPLTEETKWLIDEEQLRLMKPSAVLINTARGSLVRQESLVRALKENWIAGAGLDVFESEPPEEHNPFYDLPNVILTPHMAALTEECRIRMAVGAANNVIRALKTREPVPIANLGLLQRYKSVPSDISPEV